MRAKLNDADFVHTIEHNGVAETARIIGISERNAHKRRARLEKKLGRQITGPPHQSNTRHYIEHPERIKYKIRNGIVLIGSDAHYWPGIITTAHRAFVQFCKKHQPKAIIMNGDVIDGATISRFPVGWEHRPTLAEEIKTAQERLTEIHGAAQKAKRFWPLGNHDARLETRIATVAPELINLFGTHLKDFFPHWEPCFAVYINKDIVVKHRWKAGVHATHRNTVESGVTLITSHLHSLKITPYTDYNGTRYGGDTGCLAEPFGEQFLYSEDNPRNHRSGFIMLTFRDGRLMWPEIISVVDENHVDFRGELVEV